MRCGPPQSLAISLCTEMARLCRSLLKSQTTPVSAEISRTRKPTSTNLNDGDRKSLAKNPDDVTALPSTKIWLPQSAEKVDKSKT